MTPSPQETQLREDLRQLVAAPPAPPDADAITRRARARRRRGRIVRGAVAGLDVVALAAGITLAADGPHRPAPVPAAAGDSAARPAVGQAQTAAYVIRRTEAALRSASDYIIVTAQKQPGSGVFRMWTDPRTGRDYGLTGTGAARQASWGSTFLVGRVLHWRTTQVNFGPRTWWTQVIHAAGPITGALPHGPYGVAGGLPAQIRAWLKAGIYRVVGHGRVGGRPAIELRRPWADGYLATWVDARSYRPVRVVIADFADRPGPLRHDTIRIEESWVARTPALVALANHPHIPSGFTRVPAPNLIVAGDRCLLAVVITTARRHSRPRRPAKFAGQFAWSPSGGAG
jgi:hypothetical protein